MCNHSHSRLEMQGVAVGERAVNVEQNAFEATELHRRSARHGHERRPRIGALGLDCLQSRTDQLGYTSVTLVAGTDLSLSWRDPSGAGAGAEAR